MAVPSGSQLFGIDEFFNSAGTKFAPLGFGFNNDWEVIERKEISTSVATVELGVDTFDPTEWDEIEITVDRLSTVTDNIALNMTVSDDNGVTFEAGTGYEWAWHASRADTGARIEGHAQSAALWEIYNSWGAVSTDNHFLKITAGQMDHAAHKIVAWTLARWDGVIGVPLTGMGAFDGNTNAIDAFRFIAGSGNIDGGIYTLRGRRRVPTALVSQDDWVVITDEENVAAAATHDFFWPDQVYDEIEVTVTGTLTGTDNRNLQVRLSSDGSTFHSGASDYRCSFQNWQDNGTGGGNATESTTGAAEFNWLVALGTATDELMDGQLRIQGVSNTLRKTKGNAEGGGIIFNGTQQNMQCSFIDLNTNDSCQGIQLRGASAATMAFDRVRIRGRRKTPIGVLKQDWEVIETQDITSSVGNISFTDIPSAEFDEFELTITGLNTDTTGQSVEVRFSNDNGATYDSGANYEERGQRHQSTGTTAENVDAQSGIQLINNFGSATDRLASGRWRLWSMNGPDRVRLIGNANLVNDVDDLTCKETYGQWEGTGSDGLVTALRLIPVVGGNFTAGKLVLRGRRTT